MTPRFGTNAVNIDLSEALSLDLGRVEFCLGGMDRQAEKLAQIERNMEEAQALGLSYSVHLPLYIPPWFNHYFLDAFFLDPDPGKRELSFRLLAYNLQRLKGRACDYYVIHFPGIYQIGDYEPGSFEPLLTESLDRLEAMAEAAGVRLMLEYFGSNRAFYKIEAWDREIEKRPHLGILADTGHLLFASRIHRFDFLEGLRRLSRSAEAYHLWTTRGRGIYGGNPNYVKFHHIPMHLEQKPSEGWAFDTEAAARIIAAGRGPVIVEASSDYGGKAYIREGIESLRSFFEQE